MRTHKSESGSHTAERPRSPSSCVGIRFFLSTIVARYSHRLSVHRAGSAVCVSACLCARRGTGSYPSRFPIASASNLLLFASLRLQRTTITNRMRCRGEYTQKTNSHRTRPNVTAFNAALELGRLHVRRYSNDANERQKHIRKEKRENERIAQ